MRASERAVVDKIVTFDAKYISRSDVGACKQNSSVSILTEQ